MLQVPSMGSSNKEHHHQTSDNPVSLTKRHSRQTLRIFKYKYEQDSHRWDGAENPHFKYEEHSSAGLCARARPPSPLPGPYPSAGRCDQGPRRAQSGSIDYSRRHSPERVSGPPRSCTEHHCPAAHLCFRYISSTLPPLPPHLRPRSHLLPGLPPPHRRLLHGDRSVGSRA